MSSGWRPAVLVVEGLAPSEDQSALKLVVAEEADGGLDKSRLVGLLTVRVVAGYGYGYGYGGGERVDRRR